ncbi:tail protein X [Chelativorans intermedius]|uniref:Tail protein X n=1 Tax=Chelativorans intermedius TaxID=515947 RepID=A0ABV6D7J9_9HYPH|nr:tail protein X [Chelativorans intermedius]MCT8999226.1 tail protein X [Chelativorans intermedius]
MTDAIKTETITVQDDQMTLDLLLWRRFRRQIPGIVERTLKMNPGLADLGIFLPLGTKVIVPIDQPDSEPKERPTVRLWD